MNVLIVDDEKPARERLAHLLSELPDEITILGEAENGKEALTFLKNQKPDVVFLDIQMPVLDGFDVVALMSDPKPNIIFVTAYDEYAIQAFEVNAVDYLLKPVRKERLQSALGRVSDQKPEVIEKLLTDQRKSIFRRVPVSHQQEILLLAPNEILWLQADGPDVTAITEKQTYRADFTLDELEHRLSTQDFFRIHRAFLVNLNAIRKLIPWFNHTFKVEMSNGQSLSVARRRLPELKKMLGM